jgi:hypothetical protein
VIYDSTQNPILTNQGALSGSAAQIDVNLNGTLTRTAFPTATNGPSVVTFLLPFSGDSPFQVSYAANPSQGESYINIINTGANGAPLLGPGFGAAAGNICANVYAFSPDEQLISCCSCFLTPNAVANLGVNRDLTIKTLTGVVPTSVVIKLVATLAGTAGAGGAATCNNSAASLSLAAVAPAAGALVFGMVASGTTPQSLATNVGPYTQVEHPFVPSTLSAGEVASIAGRCASILGNGSGFGVCLSCRPGALGGQKQ